MCTPLAANLAATIAPHLGAETLMGSRDHGGDDLVPRTLIAVTSGKLTWNVRQQL